MRSHLTTLSAFRNILPIGVTLNGERLTEFALHPYTTEYEFSLCRLFPQEADNTPQLGKVANRLLPSIVEHIGGYSPKELATALGVPPLRLFDSMFAADVLTIVLNVRLESSGVDVGFVNTCPSCGTENDDDPRKGRPYHDLSALDIRCVEGEVGAEVSLRSPVTLNNQTVSSLHLSPLTFAQFQQLENCPDSLLDIELLKRMVVEEGFDYRQVRDLRDRQKLINAARELFNIGPDMEMTVAMLCYKCRFEWESRMAPSQAYSFYFNLLRPAQEEYLQNILFFLTFGEQAPCKSIQEAKQLPVRERNFYVDKLNESYQKQKEEMDKASRKGKSTKKSF